MAEVSAPEERIARIRLSRSPTIGSVTYWQLIGRFGSAQAALEAVPALASRGGGAAPNLFSRDAAEREVEQVSRLGARYLFRGDPDYPSPLAEVESAPALLIAKGAIDLFERPMIAMVGARNASAAACRFARQLAQQLGASGAVVVSGLARGIDSAAHDGALESGTIAACAGGIDIVYPPENAERQRAIGERGLLLSEQPPGLEPRARHFPRRNRIIAGLASGTVVIEAAPKSGSLITARLAGDFGRDVMAVPGSPLDPRAQGCNQLIRDGAILVQNAEDVLETLQPFGLRPVAERGEGYDASPLAEVADADRVSVSDLLSPTPVSVDEILRQAGVAPPLVQTVLLELELAGRIERHAGGRVSLSS
jgi:DNA processing protein